MSKKYAARQKISNNLIEQLLHNRGVEGEAAKEYFLNPDFVCHLHDPFLLPDMQKAVLRIIESLENDEKIAIWSDYDADGIPGAALLHDFFKLIGFGNFVNYIPNRHSEGYGLNLGGLDELGSQGVKLLITIDCGIRDNEQIAHASKLGMEVIVTDHHEPAAELPKAFAIVNPKREDSQYPEKILCGAGVVWKLIEAILKNLRDGREVSEKIKVPKLGQEKWLLDLVGIATLSDMVPLVGENRALAHFGLSVLRKNRRPGLSKLLAHLRINKNNLTEDDVCFMITPRINAASRMGHPLDAFKLLVAQGESEAQAVVEHLDNINHERKGMVAALVKEAKKKIKEKFESGGEKPVVVLGNPDWRPALLGLVANSLAEEFNRPVFLWGRENGEFIKGSCRSDGSTDLVALMERARDAFTEFGGHKFSGGFGVSFEKIHTLEDALVEASTHVISDGGQILVDAELRLSDISERSVSEMLRLGPFGAGNEKPVFIFRDVLPEKINRFGKAKEHLSITFRDGSTSLRGISFFTSPDQFGDALKENIKTNVVANVEKSDFGGRSEIRLRIVDFFL